MVKIFKPFVKKIPSIVKDLKIFQTVLLENPTLGESLGNNRYKVRLRIASKGKGKRGGGRVITYIKYSDEELWLLTMYDKSETENVTDAFLDDLVETINS